MKANEKEAKRSLSVAELKSELRQGQDKLFRLRFKHQVTPAESPLEIRTLRRQVARLKTWIAERDTAAKAAAKEA